MEDINNSNTEPSPLNPIVKSSAQQTEITESDNKRKKNPLVLLLVFIIILLIGVIAFLFLTNRNETSFIENETNIEEEENDDTELESENSDQEVVKKEYYNETFGVRFSYPIDWVVIDEKEDGDMAFTLKIGKSSTVSEDIFFYEIKPTEPTFCIYSESELTVSDGPTYEAFYDNYVEIGTDGIYRRSYAPYGTVNSYIICQKYDEGLYRNPEPGFVTYWNFDKTSEDAESMLSILDSILMSYEYTGDL